MSRRGTLPVACALCLLAVSVAPAARAGSTAATLLEKRISVDFSGTPLQEAVLEIGRLTGAAVAVDGQVLRNGEGSHPVTLKAADVRARDALETVLRQGKAACVLHGRVLVLRGSRYVFAESVVLRVYDVRDMTFIPTCFPGPSYSPFASAAHSCKGPMSAGPISVEEPPSDRIVGPVSLSDIVMCFVRPRSWAAELGTSVEERYGRLVVMQSEAALAEIEALLGRTRARESVFVGLDVRSFVGKPRKIDSALGRPAVPGFLTADERQGVLARLTSSKTLAAGSARTISANGQRVHVVSGVQAPHVQDIDVSGRVPDPVVTSSLDGIVVDIRPQVSSDRRHVTFNLELQSYARDRATRTHTVSTGRSAVVPAPARVQRPEFDARELRTSVRAPAGMTAYFRAPCRALPRPSSRGRPRREVLFLVRPTVLAPLEGELPPAGERPTRGAGAAPDEAVIIEASSEWTRRERPLNGGECPGFSKPVSAEFDETPVHEGVQWLGARAGFDAEVDRESMEQIGSPPVTFRAVEMPAGEVLGWLAALGGYVYDVEPPAGGKRPGVVFYSRQIGTRRSVELRVYDVQDLTSTVEQYPGPFWFDGSRGHCGPGLTICAEDPYELTPASLAEMIMARVRPDEWAGEFGTLIEERGSRLIAMQRPPVHDEIAALLAAFRRRNRRMVSVGVRVLKAPSAVVDEASGQGGRDGMLCDASLASFESRLEAEPARLLASARLTCFNTQRVHALGGGRTCYVADYGVRGDSYDPVVRGLVEGLTADVWPILSDDGRTMLLELRLDYAERVGDLEEFTPFGPEDGSRALGIPTPGPVQQPRLAMTKVRSTVRARSGATVMLSASDPRNPAAGNEIVFLVTATTVSF